MRVVIADRLEQRLRVEHGVGGGAQQSPGALTVLEFLPQCRVVSLAAEDAVEKNLPDLSGVLRTHGGVGEDQVVVQGGGQHPDRFTRIDTRTQLVAFGGTSQDRLEHTESGRPEIATDLG